MLRSAIGVRLQNVDPVFDNAVRVYLPSGYISSIERPRYSALYFLY